MPSCPEFVGRHRELAALSALIVETATAVSSRAALVHGEAGIGKTRLVEELRRRSSGPALVVTCSEAGRALPWGALSDALAAKGQDIEPAEPLASRSRSEEARAQGRARRYRSLAGSVSSALGGVLRGQTRLIILEDIHWADDATLAWIPYLARSASAPMLLVLTFRDERSDLPFADCLAEVERLRIATDVRLGPLARSEVVRMVELIPTTSRGSAEEIADLADGNPLFVEELASLGLRRDGPWDRSSALPRVVQLTFRQRTGGLSDEALAVMRTAAALGREFNAEHLASLDATAIGEVRRALDELVSAGLMVEREPGWFAFRHALVRSAAYESVPPGQRVTVHRRIATALEGGLAGRPELRAAELLHHWSMAGDTGRLVIWAEKACDRALLAFSPAEACAHATKGIDATVRARGEATHDLLSRRGDAHSWMGRFDRAQADHEAALAVARAGCDRQREWRSLVDLGALAVEADFGRAGALFDEALDLARILGEDRGLAETLAWVGFWHMMGGDPLIAQHRQEEALAVLEGLGDRAAMGEVLDLLGWTAYVRSDLPASRDAYRRGVDINRSIGAGPGLASCLAGYATRGADCFQVDSVWCEGEPLAWSNDADEAVEFARSIGWRSGQSRALIWFGLHLAALGEHRRAFDCARDGLAIAVEDRQVRFESTAHILYTALWMDLLDFDRALPHGREAVRLARDMRSPTVAATAVSFLARAQLGAGDVDMARAALAGADAVTPNSMPSRLLDSARVEVALAAGDFARALERVDALAAAAPGAGRGQVIPRLWYLRGLALAGLERGDEADGSFAEGASGAKRMRQRPILWRTLVAAGRSMSAGGAPQTAGECFGSARRVITGLGAALGDAGLGASFVGAATSGLPSPQGAGRDSEPLTARENEVAALVARGMTNREIADHLVLSVRTVEKHVANTLMKLAMRSRVELAVWAADQSR